MKLIYGIPSPYARKVRLVIAAKGLESKIELVVCNPFEDPGKIRTKNPLGKVPALLLDDGTALFDSRVIIEYLDHQSTECPLLPAAGPARWRALRWQALADGVLDAAYNIAVEGRREEAQRSSVWTARWVGGIERGLEEIESQVGWLAEAPPLVQIAVACLPDYIDLRAAEHIAWRDECPRLANWFDIYTQSQIMKKTHPLYEE